MAAFTVTADDRDELVDTFKAITTRSSGSWRAERYDDRDPAFPPLYTGTVGNPPPPADLIGRDVGRRRRCSTTATASPTASRATS